MWNEERKWRRGRWRDKGYPLSLLCGHMSFLYHMGWVFLEGDAHFTWYHCFLYNSVVDCWHLKSTANTSILNPSCHEYSRYKSFLQCLPQMHASSPDSLSDRAVTQGCLLPKTVWEDLRKGLWGQGLGLLTSARSCWGLRKRVVLSESVSCQKWGW